MTTKQTTLQQDLGSLAADLVTAGNHEGAALVTAAVNAMAAPQQAVAASSEPVKLTDWDRISKAAATACNEYGQWMPERWIQLFVAAYNKE